MTHSTALVSTVVQRIVLGMLAVALLTDIGCVSRRAYERIKAETVEHTQALETARADVQELDQQIAGLQARIDMRMRSPVSFVPLFNAKKNSYRSCVSKRRNGFPL
ncbi:MAG: hypothetical protein HC938_17120 [Nitrospira sp.]|nr:hypothetical protein [Nitrospira sp.]